MTHLSKYLAAILFSLLFAGTVAGQALTYDVGLSLAIYGASSAEKSSWNEVHKAQKAIIAAQTATTAVVDKLDQVQRKIYKGLTTVNSAIRSGYTAIYIGKLATKTVNYEKKMMKEAAGHPLAALWAAKIQKRLLERTTACITDLNTLVLKAGDGRLLMRAGEREKLLWNIKMDLEVMSALAISSYYKIHWVVIQGLVNAINPFSGYVDVDKRLMNDVLNNFQF